MNDLSKAGFEAANVYFSAVCNLRCRYCFQPKIGDIANPINKDIQKWISSGNMEKDILCRYGKDIKDISFWGGEPSINLPFIVERIPYYLETFPELKTFSYSTNMSTKKLVKNTVDFVRALYENNIRYGRKIKLRLQFSLDGPPEINDYNRIGAKADTICKNILFLLQELKDIPAEYLQTCIKGTQSSDSLKWLAEGNNFEKFYMYFDKWQKRWTQVGARCGIPQGGTYISLVYPGNFTKEDGLLFAKLLKKQCSEEFQKNLESKTSTPLIFDNQITERIKGSFSNLRAGYYRDYKGELLNMCSCSACKTCGGISYDKKFHICQATYLFNEDIIKYIEDKNLISEFEEKQGFSFRNFKNVVADNMVVDYDDDLKLSRLLYKMNTANNNLTMKIQYLEIILSEMAAAGQISECYLNPAWRDAAIAFTLFGTSECPADNIWEFGSSYIRSTSQMKLVFNGAFEYYINNFYNDILNVHVKKEGVKNDK